MICVENTHACTHTQIILELNMGSKRHFTVHINHCNTVIIICKTL